MRREATGTYESTSAGGETIKAFVPKPRRIYSYDRYMDLLNEGTEPL